jgi:membrane fusion protein (multidrug efflux system)
MPRFNWRSVSLRWRVRAPHLAASAQKHFERRIVVQTEPSDPQATSHDSAPPPSASQRRYLLPIAIGCGALVLIVAGSLMVRHAESKQNHVALSQTPKLVSVIEPRVTTFSSTRTYIGTIEPWVEAHIGPQLVSAYVDTVLVRPGAVVKRGDVLATLDCRNTSATSQAVEMQARALESRQKALASESGRIQGLLDGGFVSPNEAEQKSAQSSSELAQLLAQQAKLLGSALEVKDCVLRAPFNGEIATRTADPGAFVRPGSNIVSIVDRTTLRVTADAPEVDFDSLAPGSKVSVHILTTRKDLTATIARRAPAADLSTRTVHFELDVPDPDRAIPVNTTAEIHIDVGQPQAALAIPLSAATLRNGKASVFVIENNLAHLRVLPVEGELSGKLYLSPLLAAGSRIVSEGRALLAEGDRVQATLDPDSASSTNQRAGEP